MHAITNNSAFFFDRDGIVNHRKIDDYVTSVEEFSILPEFYPLFKKVTELGFITILITNQQGIGKGLMNVRDLQLIHSYMQKDLLQNVGVMFDDIRFCGSLKSDNDHRRKPEPGMILEAANQWRIHLSTSFMVGDMESDIIAGKRAGVKTIYVGDVSILKNEKPDYNFKTLADLSQYLGNIVTLE